MSRARSLIDAGGSWNSAAKALGVWPGSLQRWASANASDGFKPVVVTDVAPSAVESPVPSSVTVTTPDGFRVDGLDVDGAFLLLEMLRCSA